ncbi:methyltransferase domain-containing protein [Streptomyces sp. NPDC057638]|uniref:methyltransferase domain-containing protein n=1 Tax=Streptomyces sp. NPDC057638 TaxID=3346190 RepID=UPI0036753EE8
MLLASVNLNKRLGATGARSNLAVWLREHGVRVLVAQEPFKPTDRTPPILNGFVFVGGDGHLAVWVSEDLAPPTVSVSAPWVQRVELEWLLILQVHLDAYGGATRVAQLTELAAMAFAEEGRPLLVCGDFNLAPRPADGLFGEEPSAFTTEAERQALHQLKLVAGLIDTTANEVPPVFTFERSFNGKPSRFRCDLALLSDHLAATTAVTVDASVRSGPAAFTDHSALLIDLPLSPQTAEPDDVLFTLRELTGVGPAAAPFTHEHQPHKTAMSRQMPSPASRTVTEYIAGPFGLHSVLDHGCGRGADVAHYRSAGLDAEGFDPHDDFGWPRPERSGFDLVTSVFVLNVLADPWQRIQALKDAASFARPGGYVVVVTRSPEEITKAAAAGGWRSHHDGFWSNRSKGTFQRGISPSEISALARRAGLQSAEGAPVLPLPGGCHAVLTKPTA